MAIMIKKLFKNGTFLYKMRLLAGKGGLTNLVEWVHIIEYDSGSTFLHGGELVFTAGILNREKDWLLNFARKLYQGHVSAFVVNLGPYTQEVTQDVIDFCNEVNMPLFTIPWETKMVDMTRDFCYRIMKNDNKENTMAAILKNIVFQVGDIDTQALQMERYGYGKDSSFCFLGLMEEKTGEAAAVPGHNSLEFIAEKVAKSTREIFVSFHYKENLILVLINYSDEEVGAFVSDLLDRAGRESGERELYIGVSANQKGFYKQNENFGQAVAAMEMAKKRRESCCYYENLGLYKVLYAVDDKAILREYYGDVLGKLKAYDRENKTELTQLLKAYLENNGSLQLVSEKKYVHRNTVTNQLKRIEKITGLNPLDLEDKLKFYLGFCVGEIL